MEYEIKKGKHRSSGLKFGLTNKSHFKWKANFSFDCNYNLGNEDQYDINKLCGVSTGWHHHKDSIRFGWTSDPKNKNIINIFAYQYVEGKRHDEWICDVQVCEEVYFSISIYATKDLSFAIMTVNDESLYLNINKKPWSWKYKLFPYFGGNQVAPHNMYIELTEL